MIVEAFDPNTGETLATHNETKLTQVRWALVGYPDDKSRYWWVRGYYNKSTALKALDKPKVFQAGLHAVRPVREVNR